MTTSWTYFWRLAFAFFAVVSAVAAPLERELGSGLTYYRVHELPGDLPAKPNGRVGAAAVDVRYVQADENATTAFMAWLKFRGTTRSPVFVLANAETSAALRKALAEHERGAGVVVIGIPSRQFHPDVAVTGSAQSERRAYDALEQGVATAVLLTDNPAKVRNDEASLSKDRLAEASADAAEDSLAGKRTPPPPIDVALQRAVHLHRALVALKKI
jgi:hypothetical protein